MKLLRVCSVILFLARCSLIFGQGETWNWYFGNYAGVNFSTGSPVALLNGALSTSEGVATISDASGQLLFYSDGQTVWNSNHLVMTNGSGLWGNSSSTQSGVAIQKPGQPDTYYLFTVDDVATGAGDGMAYSIIDMTGSAGMGTVTSKNIPLVPLSNATEKITAVRHSNGIDVWVITHGWQNNQFLAFLVTSAGVTTTPVVSSAGEIHSGNNRHRAGYLKASPSGEYIACTQYDYPATAMVEMLCFNTSTGTVFQNAKSFVDYIYNAYGVEFSSDNSKLYASGTRAEGKIYQYNLDLTSGAEIVNSKAEIASGGNYAAMQVASDGKLYIARNNVYYLSVINNPDETGTACNFASDAISLGGRASTFGLPSFLQSYFIVLQVYSNSPLCSGQTLQLICNAAGATSFQWTGPDGFSSSAQNPSIPNATPANSGVYTISVTSSAGAVSSQQVDIIINPLPVVDLGSDLVICSNAPATLSPGGSFASYAWSTGSTAPSIIVYTTGNYSVTATDINGCSGTDVVSVVVNPTPGAKQILHE